MSDEVWMSNPGRIPPAVDRKGARVYVRLKSGLMPPAPWLAQTTRWTITGHDFDVAAWRDAG